MTIKLAIFDVDDVVINMDEAAKAAEQTVRSRLRAHMMPQVADEVAANLARGYDTLRIQLRSAAGEQHEDYLALEKRLRWWQRGSMERGFEMKVFSRHALLAIGLESAGVPVTAEIINDVVDAYWDSLRERSLIMEDAKVAIARYRAQGAHVHLATNSDGFLQFDEAAQTFLYDPEEAVFKKRARLGVVSEVGVKPQDVSVGDPIGKPHRAFFEDVLQRARARGGTAPLSEAVCIGDSLVNDVLPLIELGVAHGAWLVRDWRGPVQPLAEHPGVVKLADLKELERAFD